MNSNLLCNDVWRLIESFIPEENNLQTTSKYFKQILPTRLAYCKWEDIENDDAPINYEITRLIFMQKRDYIQDYISDIIKLYPNLAYLSIPKLHGCVIAELLIDDSDHSQLRKTNLKAIHSYKVKEFCNVGDIRNKTFANIKVYTRKLKLYEITGLSSIFLREIKEVVEPNKNLVLDIYYEELDAYNVTPITILDHSLYQSESSPS